MKAEIQARVKAFRRALELVAGNAPVNRYLPLQRLIICVYRGFLVAYLLDKMRSHYHER